MKGRALRRARAGAAAVAGVAALAAAVLFGGCGTPSASGGDGDGETGGRPEIGREEIVEALARGWFPGRVGDIAVIPDRRAIITYRGESNRYMHGGPWPFDSDLPLLLHGERFFRPGVYGGPASHQDIGATAADLLGLAPGAGATGRSLREAFVDADDPPQPTVVAVLVLDAMRDDYLERRAELLPNLSRLAAEGARFSEARVDYLPTNTSTAHSTISTAMDPALHGIVGNTLYDRRIGDSRQAYEGVAPYNLMALTFADRWGIATRGRAEIVVQAGTDYAAVALAGHGACILGGHPRWLAYYDSGSGEWRTNEDCYHLPPAAEKVGFGPRLDATGRTWMGHELDSYSEARRSSFFAALEGEAAVAFIEGSAFGEDEIADLFLANLKSTDYVSHKYGPFSPEMEATLAELDGWLGRIVAALEAKAGPGGLALIVTADHGMPDTPASDDLWVTYDDVTAWLDERVDPGGPGVVAFYEGSENQMFLDHERLGALGLTPDDVARTLETSSVVGYAITEAEVRRAR
ncbi:alkaline phosphatase family protein [Candidatus Palauibacter sp.]|uniref:alkaline phosphatase family protein n=1 Tax=Candidatus Palauibacter sp. TaxID=3101350 RepID=UPI003B02DBFF